MHENNGVPGIPAGGNITYRPFNLFLGKMMRLSLITGLRFCAQGDKVNATLIK